MLQRTKSEARTTSVTGAIGKSQRRERLRTKLKSQSPTSTMITSQIRLIKPPVAWNSNQSTKRITAATSNAWINGTPLAEVDLSD